MLTLWCCSERSRSPLRICTVSSVVGWSTRICWKRRSRAESRSRYLRYSSSVVAPIVWSLPRASAGFEDRGGVDRALCGTCADEVVELVDEQDDVAALGDLLHHLLEALLELAAVLRAGHQGSQIQRVDLLVLEDVGHLVRADAGGEALDDGGLPDARLADQHRIVF